MPSYYKKYLKYKIKYLELVGGGRLEDLISKQGKTDAEKDELKQLIENRLNVLRNNTHKTINEITEMEELQQLYDIYYAPNP